MRLKYFLALICMSFLIAGCNNEDDIDAIFCSGKWTLINFYETTKWDNQTPKNTRVIYGPETSQANEIQYFTLIFKPDGSFYANANASELSGTWSANGKKRYVSINYTSQPTGSVMAKLYFESLKNAKFYKGTDGFLQLAPDGKKTFMQFKH